MQHPRHVRVASRGIFTARWTVQRASLAGLLLLLAGCVGDIEHTLYPSAIAFDCKGGKVMQVNRAADGSKATVVVEGKTVLLARADSAAEEKYTDGAYMLYLDRERAFLENNGKVIFGPCLSQTVLPTVPRQTY